MRYFYKYKPNRIRTYLQQNIQSTNTRATYNLYHHERKKSTAKARRAGSLWATWKLLLNRGRWAAEGGREGDRARGCLSVWREGEEEHVGSLSSFPIASSSVPRDSHVPDAAAPPHVLRRRQETLEINMCK